MNAGKVVRKIHRKCRNSVYLRSSIIRFTVPDDKVPWNVEWSEYDPVTYTSPSIKEQLWADPDLASPAFRPVWNALDGAVDRRSHGNPYEIVGGFPLNPVGRTGLKGRGLLGRWGPNHAADPILTRWKRNCDNLIENDMFTGKPILQFVGIQRKDCLEWAIPGGMVDPGETVTTALKREFMEEALNVLSNSAEKRKEKEESLKNFFTNGLEIYKGYVDDPRNTDNAWMETVATNFHDEDGSVSEKINLEAGDDASKVRWIDVCSTLKLYASHLDFICETARARNCHWQRNEMEAEPFVKSERSKLVSTHAVQSKVVSLSRGSRTRKQSKGEFILWLLTIWEDKMNALQRVIRKSSLLKPLAPPHAGESTQGYHIISVPPRRKVKTSELVVSFAFLTFCFLAYPIWMVFHVDEYQGKKTD